MGLARSPGVLLPALAPATGSHSAPPLGAARRRMDSRSSRCSLIPQLLPRMLTMWQRYSSRSISVAAMTSAPSTAPYSSNLLLEVRTVDACLCRALISWKNRTALSRLTGR